MKYLKKFNTYNEYESYTESIEYIRPNVSKITSDRSLIYKKKTQQDKMTLIHYWNFADINNNENYIVDRINNLSLRKLGKNFELSNGYVKLNREYNYVLLSPVNINLGDIWEVECKFILTEAPTNQGLSHWIFDFGSLMNSTHAFGLAIKYNSIITSNTKFNGNDSVSYYDIPKDVVFNDYGVPAVISVGMERYDDTYNRFYIRYKNKLYYGANLVERQYATFNSNFDTNNFYIGRGTIEGAQYQSEKSKYIKYLKIFKGTNI